MRKTVALPLITAAVVGCSEIPTRAIDPSQAIDPSHRNGAPAPLYLAANRPPQTLPDRYIVVVNDHVRDAGVVGRELGVALGFEVIVSWNTGLRFFAAELSPVVVEALRRDSRIKYVAEDQKLQLGNTYSPPSWGLDRIDQPQLPLNNTFQDYMGGNTILQTTHTYIIDTGIRFSHVEFEGRAIPAFDYDSVSRPRGSPNFAVDCHGHGTHVAATVGGQTFGVFKPRKNHRLYGVRVLDCAGSEPFTSVVASGVNWVTANHIKPAVTNMSLWDNRGINVPLDDAVRASISAGVNYVVIAGNASGADACNFSPGRVAEAITVASTDQNDARSSFSNIGPCVDIFAPGRDIVSAWIGSDNDSRTVSGTSFAAPHVAGAMAMLIATDQAGVPQTSPAGNHDRLVGTYSTKGVVINPGPGSPNRLLNSLFPFVVHIQPRFAGAVPCGQSRTYQIEGIWGVGPYTGYAAYRNGIQITNTETFTLQAGNSYEVAGIELHAWDARGTHAANFVMIVLCG